jgi:hypothetical protein
MRAMIQMVALQGSQVAGMRAEVKRLRDTLASRLEASGDANDTISTNKEISSLITGVAAARARESLMSMQASMRDGGVARVSLDDGTMLDEHDVLELELLQIENEELRYDS